jgi:hypothetical protein
VATRNKADILDQRLQALINLQAETLITHLCRDRILHRIPTINKGNTPHLLDRANMVVQQLIHNSRRMEELLNMVVVMVVPLILNSKLMEVIINKILPIVDRVVQVHILPLLDNTHLLHKVIQQIHNTHREVSQPTEHRDLKLILILLHPKDHILRHPKEVILGHLHTLETFNNHNTPICKAYTMPNILVAYMAIVETLNSIRVGSQWLHTVV